jgi:predicted enzyme related to lactoylglutathione lyase
MIGYTLVGTNDLDRAKSFYDALFGEIGVGRMMEMGQMCAWGASMDRPAFGVTRPYDGGAATAGNGTMIALVVDTRDKVDRLHAKAMAMGGKDEGAPGVRGEEGPQAFYAGYCRDLDGNKLCAFRVGPA